MRILQLVESAAAGVGRHVLDLTAELLDRDHEVHLLYSAERADATFRRRIGFLRERKRCVVSELTMRRNPHWTDILAALRLRAYAQSRGPFDVAHFHSSKAGLIGRLALRGINIRRVYTPHALSTLRGGPVFKMLVSWVERLLACACEDIVMVSRVEFDHALSIGLPADRLRLIHPGIRSASSPIAGESLAPAVRIGFVGRLVEQKSPEVLLTAFQILSVQMSRNARLVIVGEGPLRHRMEVLAGELGISERVTWVGGLDGSLAMKTFDIFAITSRYEGFPYVVLEAMSAALPVVATRVGGTSEAILDGENGFLTPIGDAQAMAKALATLVDDASLRARMGRESLRAVNQFSLDRMVDQTLTVYERVRYVNQDPLFQPLAEELNKGVRG